MSPASSDAPGMPHTAALPEVFKATLSNCDREPIHMPGSIQPHGALMAFDINSGSMVHASTNLGRWLPVGALPVSGRSLADLLGGDGFESVMRALSARSSGLVRHQIVPLPARPDQGQPEALQALVHMHRDIGFAEVEPLPPGAPLAWMQALNDTVDALRTAESLEDLVQRTAMRVKRVTGLDRVMVYRFDAQHNGHVVADAREPGMESFYDLHYPASDIPAQARELYGRNLVRYIPDVDYEPEAVLPWVDASTLQPLDMSHATLRSVSPLHLQYLRNMGVRSTLTLSLIVDGRLWGLVAGHHGTPTALPLEMRRACYALAVTAGYMTGWFASQARQAETAQRALSHAAVLRAFNCVQAPLHDVVEECSSALCDVAAASGGALWSGDTVVPFGLWPEGPRGESILRHVRHGFEVSQSAALFTEHADLEPALAPAELRHVCGLAGLRFDGFASAGMVWVRAEFRREVLWGGDPDKPVNVEIDAQGQPVLSPRTSFAQWVKLVTQRCRPWSDVDRSAIAAMAGLSQVLAVRESLAQISLSDRKFRSLLALQSDAFWQTDAAGRLITFSKPPPFPHGELHGLTLPETFVGACHAEGVAMLVAALAAQRPFRGLRLTANNDAATPGFGLEISGEPTRNPQGDITGWHGALRDVSHELQVEVAVREKAAAELASQAKSKFLSQLSHELRTPLNAVIGFSQLVVTDPTTPAKQREYIGQVERAGHWLLAMITDLLDLSKVETGNLGVALSRVELSPLWEEVVGLVAPLAAEHGVRLIPPEGIAGVAVQADPKRLRQVLVNLSSNAVKYNRPKGELRLTVAVQEPGQIRIDVRDTGEGMKPEQLLHLYEPFNRLGREALNVSGTGIGLVISRQLVMLMGGTLDVSSEFGVGSCFSVTLAGDVGVASVPGETAPVPAAAAGGRSGLVLYVEDEPVNELLMRTLVEVRLGYRYATAASAQAGLLAARSEVPTLMLVDLNLPDHDGLWLAAQVRADPALRAVRLVAVTADATLETRARLLDNGFAECWSKPLDLQAVQVQLRHLVGHDPG